jgi:chitodextrinase
LSVAATVSGLLDATTYYFRLTAYDAVGNRSGWSVKPDNVTDLEISTRTPALSPDTTPPTAPVLSPSPAVSAVSVTLSWTASTDVGGVAKYWVLRDGVAVGTVTAPATTWTDTGVTASRSYAYAVEAVDLAGNLGPASTLIIVTPAAGPFGPTGSSVVETAVFPNPAVGKDPTIRAFVGDADTLEVTIYDVSGAVVHSDRIEENPTGTVGGRPFHDYLWRGTKASGVYFAVIHGRKGGDVIRGRVKFIVVR